MKNSYLMIAVGLLLGFYLYQQNRDKQIANLKSGYELTPRL